MKSFAVLALGAGVALAQSLTDLPQCGQTCISNMINIASSQFGCSAGDVSCYCTNQDFGFGIRDCSNQACSSAEAAQVQSFGVSFCQNIAASASSVASAVSTGAIAPLTSALASASGSVTSNSATPTGAVDSALSSLASSVNSAISSIVASASGAAGSAASSARSAASSAAASATGSPSAGAAPKMTALPFVGAAGMAAWLLL